MQSWKRFAEEPNLQAQEISSSPKSPNFSSKNIFPKNQPPIFFQKPRLNGRSLTKFFILDLIFFI